MKMKSHLIILAISIITVLFHLSCKNKPSGNEKPVTRESEGALKSIHDGRSKLEDNELITDASLYEIGNNYIFKGDYDSARKYYNEYFDRAGEINEKLSALHLIATSYVHEGKPGDALKTFDELRALAEEENLVTPVIFSYIDEGVVATEIGNPFEGLKYIEKAVDLAEKLPLSEPDRELLITITTTSHFYALASNNELDKATDEAEKCKLRVESRNNPGEEMQLNSCLAFIELKKGNYDRAIEYFNKVDVEDPWVWYYNALAYNKKGEKQNAIKLFEKIANCNSNSLMLAIVRKPSILELKKIE